jgi:hypothetical protein
MQLSLLIPRLESGKGQFSRMVESLEFQIRNAGRSSDLEMLYYPSCSEDLDLTLRMRDHRALQREEFIDSVLCYYRSRRWWCYQGLLDGSEALRRKLGIGMVNRLRKPDSRILPDETASRRRGNGLHARD